ncbi:MAG: hypothetical protein HUK26_06525, partial [Duodenibacillus sp.]|nr:hypothetical protein [Duodenibacillus sp.]
MPAKHGWSGVEGLPAGANVQVIKGTPCVFFRCKRIEDGAVRRARDCLGVIENGRFS